MLFSLMLAPMEGYTDAAFRTLCFRHGADLTFTEMTHAGSLLRGNQSSLSRVANLDSTPVQIQLLVGNEEELKKFVDGFQPFTGFKGINLNLSCPSPDVIRQGKGAALVKRVTKTQRLVETIKRHGHPASVKIRLGINAHEKTLKLYLNSLREVDADFFIVHAKTATQTSSEPADYSVYPECVDAASGKPVIANGDVESSDDVNSLRCMGVSGVMIGRAALRDPSIFNTVKNELGYVTPRRPLPSREELIKEYFALSEVIGSEKYRTDLLRVLGKRGDVIY